jgi:hypothetical protein
MIHNEKDRSDVIGLDLNQVKFCVLTIPGTVSEHEIGKL